MKQNPTPHSSINNLIASEIYKKKRKTCALLMMPLLV